MVSFDMQAKGFQATDKLLTGARKNLREYTADALHQLLLDIVAEARHILQQNRSIDSGRLLASVRILAEDREELSGVVGTDVPHAIWIEFGRGPVKAKPGKTLHWIDKETGEDVFATEAGPAEAQPFLEPAVSLHTRKFQDIYVDFVVEGLDRLI